ncbi:hypothetical protein [Mucilaginibacter jinjuensis]|uniref:DUF4397 domain-containing protein n=1 Tax=Mucilaginibacter jinjuensis TaxID=1176721 RepID=A0ABY7T3B5_9SPHI|nr:hypothetical protein [Mucilaginibacter jinjuensis]WCT10940.1 hypothetical protein PQO05_19575 [Mucilaginibacter jinjuensis]
MNNFSLIKFPAFLLLVAVVFTSCKKDPGDDVSTVDTQLQVSFSSAGVPITSTDSMTTTFINGTDTITKKAIRAGTFYSVSLKGLKTTTYTTLTKLYTAADTNGDRHMYRLAGSVDTQTGGTVLAPTGNQFDTWKANYIYYNADLNISFAIAALPTDPYFEVKLPASLPYQNLYIARTIYKTNNKVQYVVKFSSVTFKTADYKGFHTNTTSFADFATTAASASYDAADFSLELYNEVNNDYKILYTHTSKF